MIENKTMHGIINIIPTMIKSPINNRVPPQDTKNEMLIGIVIPLALFESIVLMIIDISGHIINTVKL